MIAATENRSNAERLKVIIVADGRARRILALAQQIERQVPAAKIYGIVYKIPDASKSPLNLRSIAHSFADWTARLLLGLIHGGRPRTSLRSESDCHILVRNCQQAGWDLMFTDCVESPEVLDFLKRKEANFAVATGFDCLPSALAGLTLQGMIRGQVFTTSQKNMEATNGVEVTSTRDAWQVKISHVGSQGESLLDRFELSPDPLDTKVSLELKSNLIMRDLLVQWTAAIAEQPESAPDRVEQWRRNMIPSYLSGTGTPAQDPPIDQAPPLRLRSTWKLCAYSLLLLSPSIILRNWLRRWKKQYPVIILTSHLISDRHHRMSVPTEAFLSVVEYLQRHYRIVSLSRACELLKSGSIDEPTLVITFDDGYEDNFVNLRAVSEETGVPVVLFVSTDMVTNHREFTHDSERGLLGFRALTWDQLRYWGAGNAEFESHTCSHYDCGSTDAVSLARELEESKRSLENQLGKPVKAFSFPFGKPKNMSATGMTIAAKIYDHYLSSFGGENAPSTSDNHKHLLRTHIQGNSWETEMEIQGVFVNAKSLRRQMQIWYWYSGKEAWDDAVVRYGGEGASRSGS